MKLDDYETTKEAGERLGVSANQVTVLAKQGRIPGAIKVSRSWFIPKESSPSPVYSGLSVRTKLGRPPKWAS